MADVLPSPVIKPTRKVTSKVPIKTKKSSLSKQTEKKETPQTEQQQKESYEANGSPKIARFEKLNPKTHRFFFDEKRIYANGIEYSFEELRAVMWKKKREKEDEKARTKELEEEVRRLRTELEQLQKRLGKNVSPHNSPLQTGLSRTPLKQRNDGTTGRTKGRNVDKIVVAAAVSGANHPPPPAFEIFEDATTGVVPLIKPSKPAFEIYSEPTSEVTRTVSNDIVSEETTNIQPIVKPTQPAFEIYCEETGDVNLPEMSKRFSINPVGGMTENSPNFGNLTGTFFIPSETEFISRETIIASTPAAPGAKKPFGRVKSFGKSEQTEMTGKLETIREASKEYTSSSSGSSSSGAHTTAGFTRTRTRFLSGVDGIIPNPFDEKLILDLLDDLDEPILQRKGFFVIAKNLPKIRESSTKLTLGSDKFIVGDLKDEGNYAKVYTAQIESTDDCTGHSTAISEFQFTKWFALKICKPANVWEFYICDELHKRIELMSLNPDTPVPDVELSLMLGNPAGLYRDASVLVDEFCQNGTLMRIVNLYKKSRKFFPKSMTAYFALELLQIIKVIHSCQIIHADLKPDNVLILNFPSKEEISSVSQRTTCIKVIDFGRSIDMKLFPGKTTFTHFIETKGSACPEMLDKKTWSYEPDWFGFLDCLHIMIFQEYIDVIKENDRWKIGKKINQRVHFKDIWEPLFDALLNIPESEDKACPSIVDETIAKLTEYTSKNNHEVYREAMEMEAFVEKHH